MPFRHPAISQIKALCSCSWSCAQLCYAVTCGSNGVGCGQNESLSDPAAFEGRIDKQSPDAAVSWIARGQPFDDTIVFPDMDRSMDNVPFLVCKCHSARVREAVLVN